MQKLITVNELRLLMPDLSLAKAAAYAPLLEAAMWEFNITTKRRRAAFLAQLAHESAQLRHFEEIASGEAYENRIDLGNTVPGDGKRFKGRGPIQLTGRRNYTRFGRLLDLDLVGRPTLAAKPENGFRIAGLFWKLGGLNQLADKLTMKGDRAERETFTQITKRINGGTNGLTDRLNYFRVAKQVLHGDEDPNGHAPNAAPAKPQPTAPRAESPEPNGTSANPHAPDSDVDLLGSAVTSGKAKAAGLKLWPRIAKQGSAALTFLWALAEANRKASILVLLVLAAAVAWVVYHNRRSIKRHKDWLKVQLAKVLVK